MSISKQNLHTFLSPKLFLIRPLHTEFADIIAGLIVIIVFDIACRYFRHIPQHVGGVWILILPDAPALDIETGKTENLLLKNAELLVRQLAHKKLLREARIAGILVIVLDVIHPPDEKLLGDTERIAKLRGVKPPLFLIHHHHDIVSRLVIHHEFTRPVTDDAPGRILHFLQKSVTVGILLIIIAHHLQREQTDDIDDNNRCCHPSNHITTIIQIEILHLPT